MTELLDDSLRQKLIELIVDRLGSGLDGEVRVKSIEVLENKLEIVIEVEISASAQPEEIASRYFGLTGRVRDVLGESWRNFYPVITPAFEDRLHA